MNFQHSNIICVFIVLFFFVVNCSFSETSITGEDHKREFTIRCNVAQFQSTGIGLSKKDAKRIAATEMIKLINSSDSATLSDSNSSLCAADAVGALITFCRQCNFNLPKYEC